MTDRNNRCQPHMRTAVIEFPYRSLHCFNCGCVVDPGECHCGAINRWAYDVFDGWYPTGSMARKVYRMKPAP